MDTSRNICTVLSESDLSPENVKTTVKTIEHNPNKFYLLAAGGQKALWEIIEELSKSVEDDNTLTKMRIAYDLNFDLPIVLKTGEDNSADGIAAKTFADLLELMDFDDYLNLKRTDYHVIINDDGVEKSPDYDDAASRAVAKLFQQTVLLNIDGLDIQKKSELKAAQIKKRLRDGNNYEIILEEISSNKDYIESKLADKNLSTESKERAMEIRNAFDVMLKEFKKAKARPIRIAAIGTKKAGKSVVINSLLKRDYAPTSSTLPTPNTIVYIPAKEKDTPLTLRYKGETKIFETAEDLKDFIGKEFKDAQRETGEGAGLPDMEITYPSDRGLNGYEIWDTPGPNVAFTGEHEKNAKERVTQADVCIFVMNYSNHLTTDEVKFLNYAHEIFQKNNKFYSLFITVNRLDERYAVDEGKSVDRVIDYLGYRLERLDPPYKNVVLFGTSALQKFYLDNVIDLVKDIREKNGEDVDKLPLVDEESLPSTAKYKTFKTPLKFIKDALGNLVTFHDLEKPTEKDLYALSGVPQLLRYVEYIGGNKADTEIVNSVVDMCDRQFVTINNMQILTKLLDLTDKDKKDLEELKRLIEGLSSAVDKAIDDVLPFMDSGQVSMALIKVSDLLKQQKRTAKERASVIARNMLNSAYLNEEDVKFAKTQRRYSQRLKDLRAKIYNMILGVNVDSAQALATTQKSICDTHINKIEQAIQAAQVKISEETEAVRNKVTNPTAQNVMRAFKTPEFPPAIDRLKAKMQNINMSADDKTFLQAADAASHTEQRVRYKTETRTRTVKREADGIWETFKSWFGAEYYKDEQYDVQIPENYTVDVYNVQQFKDRLARDYQSEVSAKIDEAHDMMEKVLREEIEKSFTSANEQFGQIGESYKQLYANFKKDVDMTNNEKDEHRKALERDMETFKEIEQHLQPFIAKWNEIIHGGAKG